MLFPLLYALFVSVHDYILSQGGLGALNFSNYINVFKDDLLISAAKNTVILTVSVVVLEISLGLGLAMLLNTKRLKWRNVYLFILLIPMMMPPITVGLIWRLLLHPELGIINYMLGTIGLPQPSWLGDPHLAMITIILSICGMRLHLSF